MCAGACRSWRVGETLALPLGMWPERFARAVQAPPSVGGGRQRAGAAGRRCAPGPARPRWPALPDASCRRYRWPRWAGGGGAGTARPSSTLLPDARCRCCRQLRRAGWRERGGGAAAAGGVWGGVHSRWPARSPRQMLLAGLPAMKLAAW
jgi:hypothetical protein